MYEVDSLHLDSKEGEWAWVHYYNPIYDKDLKIQIAQPQAVIMQCTGLKDKNGKLIYEGDIVKITREDWRKDLYSLVYLVCWDRTQWQLCLLKWQRPKAQRNRRCDRQFPFKDIVSFDDYTPKKFYAQCEIIGNYYENPELLEDL